MCFPSISYPSCQSLVFSQNEMQQSTNVFHWCRWKKGVDMSLASANHISCNWATGHQSPSVFCHRSKERISDQKPDLTKDQKTHVHAVKTNFWQPCLILLILQQHSSTRTFLQRARKLPPHFDWIVPLFLPLPQKVWERHWNRPWNLHFLAKNSPLLNTTMLRVPPPVSLPCIQKELASIFSSSTKKTQWSSRAPNKAEIDWISPPWALEKLMDCFTLQPSVGDLLDVHLEWCDFLFEKQMFGPVFVVGPHLRNFTIFWKDESKGRNYQQHGGALAARSNTFAKNNRFQIRTKNLKEINVLRFEFPSPGKIDWDTSSIVFYHHLTSLYD